LYYYSIGIITGIVIILIVCQYYINSISYIWSRSSESHRDQACCEASCSFSCVCLQTC